MCCEYVTIEIDKPETQEDYEEIMWYLMHDNVIVYKDEDGDWNVEFQTRCKALGEDGLCKIYKERPKVCRDHKQDECDKYGKGEFYTVLFKTREDVIEYMNKHMKKEG